MKCPSSLQLEISSEGQIMMLKRLFSLNIAVTLFCNCHINLEKNRFNLCIMLLFLPDPRDEFPKFELRI